jgi:hypothetical protein
MTDDDVDYGPDEIDEGTVDAVTEPILQDLERTARNLIGPRSPGPGFRGLPRPAVPAQSQARDAVAGAVDVGLRMVELAALIPRRVAERVLGIVAPPAPPRPAPGPAAFGTEPQADAAAGGRPARSVRSPLARMPETLTGAGRAPRPRGIPGRRTRWLVTISNRSGIPVSARFRSSDLVSPTGRSIPAGAVTFDPPSLTLGPRSSTDVAVIVHVPFEQPPGRYTGLAEAGERVRTVVELEVG